MQFQHLTSAADIRSLIQWHNDNSKFCVLDLETTSINPREATLVDIQMSGRTEDSAVLFGAEHLSLLADLKVLHVWQNFKYDWKVAYRHGLDLRNTRMHDTLLLSYLVDENRDEASLDSWVQELFKDDYKQAFWAKYKGYLEAPFEERLEYACKDIVYTGRVYRVLMADFLAQGMPESLIEHTHRLARSLFDTELLGLRVDLEYLTQVGTELKPSIDRWAGEMRRAVSWACESVELDQQAKKIEKLYKPGPRATAWQKVPKPEFNWDSSQQLVSLLYSKLKLPVKKNREGNLSTDDKALEALKHLHPVVPMIQDYREYQKVYTAFIEGTLKRMDPNGRIYPSFNINGTVTGRISASSPNLQQVPAKGEWSKVRGIYVPEQGHRILTCDYGQLEVCIAAHYSRDRNLLKIIHEGASQHDITAESLGIPRAKAKTMNFAMQYQCSHYKVRDILGCSEEDAKYYWNKYWETYAGVKKVVEECKALVDAGEPIVNPFGRRRRFPRTFEAKWQQNAAYRQAFSALIQGTGADLTHAAFYTVSERMREADCGRALFEVHDELVVMPKENACGMVADMLQYTMKQAGVDIGLSVPLTVDCSLPLERWTK